MICALPFSRCSTLHTKWHDHQSTVFWSPNNAPCVLGFGYWRTRMRCLNCAMHTHAACAGVCIWVAASSDAAVARACSQWGSITVVRQRYCRPCASLMTIALDTRDGRSCRHRQMLLPVANAWERLLGVDSCGRCGGSWR